MKPCEFPVMGADPWRRPRRDDDLGQAHDLAAPWPTGMGGVLASLEQELVHHLVQQGIVVGDQLLIVARDIQCDGATRRTGVVAAEGDAFTEQMGAPTMPYHFVFASGGQIPQGAVAQGLEADGTTQLWVARSPGMRESPAVFGIFNSVQPGKVRADFGGALIPFEGQEVLASDYEVLMDAGIWVAGSDGQIPDAAIVCGHESDSNPLFVARASLNGGLHPGKIRFAFGAAFIGFGGVETPVQNYEVLCSQQDLRRGI